MLLQVETKEIQEQLARYCKTGQYVTISGARQDRLHHYRRLVLNVVSSTIESAFPITEEWLSKEEWQLLINDFFVLHNAQTPSLWRLPEEFANFIIQNNYAAILKKPALHDLVWFEWLEIDVHTMEDTLEPISKGDEYTVNSVLGINPYFRMQHLSYPIHIMDADKAVENKGDYYVLVYRLIKTGQVRYVQLSPLHVFLINKISAQQQSLSQVLPDITSVFGIDNVKVVKEHLLLFCNNLINKKILIIS